MVCLLCLKGSRSIISLMGYLLNLMNLLSVIKPYGFTKYDKPYGFTKYY